MSSTPPTKRVETVAVIALLTGSMVLLVIGASAPLLTTTRFYWFSTTFSLITGIHALGTGGQLALACVIALFSIGVPVMKAAVLCCAAFARDQNGPLLALAERLGKWSMLEVFVAALLIVAIKLGPVADAELHYGAYLLAGSVVASGVASQLLVPHGTLRPVFSGGMTLVIGAIGGAIAATALIAFLNPGLVKVELLSAGSEARCIERVLQIDRTYARASTSESEYASRLGQIDTAACPDAFRLAFLEYRQAFERLVAHEQQGNAAPSIGDRLKDLVGLAPTRERALADIEEAWQAIEREALTHGVTAPRHGL